MTAAAGTSTGASGRMRAWYRAARPRTLSAAMSPVLAGSMLAPAVTGDFYPLRFLLALAGSVAIQAATNMLNEYFDHVQGLDNSRPQRADQVVKTGVLQPRALLRGGMLTMLFGALCGLALVAQTELVLLVIGVLSVLAGYFYTAKPLALGYRALGEVTVFIFMGPVIVMGSAFVHTLDWTLGALLLSVPLGLLVTAILHVNNVRDMEFDRAHGKRTLANLLGRRVAAIEYVLLILAGYPVLVAGVLLGDIPAAALLALVTLPSAAKLARDFNTTATAGVFPLDGFMIRTAKLHRNFGYLAAAALLVEAMRGWL